jgi:hypothetical protein
LFHGIISESIARQLRQRYATLAVNNFLSVYAIPVQQQLNGVDCGVHAIAIATELLSEDGDPLVEFDRERMRPHLMECLQQGQMLPFPRSGKKARRRVKVFKIDINMV